MVIINKRSWIGMRKVNEDEAGISRGCYQGYIEKYPDTRTSRQFRLNNEMNPRC